MLDAFEADPGRRWSLVLHLPDGLTGDPDHLPRSGWAGLTARRVGKPVVAAVGGDALGGGLEALLACPFVVLDDHAVLAFDQVAARPARRERRTGPAAAPGAPAGGHRAAVTGRRVEAAEAVALGLANRVVARPGRRGRRARPGPTTSRGCRPTPYAAPWPCSPRRRTSPTCSAAVRRPRQVYDDALLGE